MKNEFKEMFFEAIEKTGMVTNRIRLNSQAIEKLKIFIDEYYINESAKLIIKHMVTPHTILKNINNHIYNIKVQYLDGASITIGQLVNNDILPCYNVSEGFIISMYRDDKTFSTIYDVDKRKIIDPGDKYYSTCFDLHFESLLGKERYAWIKEKDFSKRKCNNCEFGHYVYDIDTNKKTMTCENPQLDINFIPFEWPDSNNACLYHEYIESGEFEIFKQEYEEHLAQITLGQAMYISDNPSQNKVLKKKI